MRVPHALTSVIVVIVSFVATTWPVADVNAGDGLTLETATEIALQNNPGMAAGNYEAAASEFAVEQAGLLPNPSLELEFEEFGGSGELSGTGVMSSRIGISQEFRLGGKRMRQMDVARSKAALALQRMSNRRIELKAGVARHFYRVAALQELLLLERENMAIVSETLRVINRRVELGESPGLDSIRASAGRATAELAVSKVERELDTERALLAAVLGETSWSYGEVVADLSITVSSPSLDDILSMLDTNPGVRTIEAEKRVAATELELARAEAWPDMELDAGVLMFNETGDHAFTVGLRIPIPVFDRNQGRVKEVLASSRALDSEMSARLIDVKSRLTELYNRLSVVERSLAVVQETILPSVQKAFDSTRKAYQVGEIGYMDLMETQKTLIDVRREQLELLSESYELLSGLESMAGQRLTANAYDNTKNIR